MSEQQKYEHRRYLISRDILLEVLEIILHTGLKYEIAEIRLNQSQAVILIDTRTDIRFQAEALKNIDEILYGYDFFRRYEEDGLNWREVIK